MRIEAIELHRGHVATLAGWHHAQWGHLYSHWTHAVALAELEEHASRVAGLPTTLVALDAGELLGSVSLVLEDAPELSEHGSPWLASLYVKPEARGRGIGARLVRAAVARAAAEGVEELFLFTPEHREFYRHLGWQEVARTALKGTAVDLMRIAPGESAAAARSAA
jgi:N-acetylglutamate synthase-like GNAT family acetyltransferase